jgi:LL-diaminopimelate aminotransferase
VPDFKLAQRIAELPPYLFAEIDRVKKQVAARGVDIISLGIGDPDLPTPGFIVDALYEAAKNPANHRYPDYEGLPAFRQAVTRWYAERFGVTDLDEAHEVVSLIGSKEGIAPFPLAFTDPGDLNLVCSPNYPCTPSPRACGRRGGLRAHDRGQRLSARPGRHPDATWERAKSIYLNYPKPRRPPPTRRSSRSSSPAAARRTPSSSTTRPTPSCTTTTPKSRRASCSSPAPRTWPSSSTPCPRPTT